MESDYLSDLQLNTFDDRLILNQNNFQYIYSLEHSFNYNNSDTILTLKIVDSDGKLEDTVFGEPFYQKIMRDSLQRYLDSPSSISFSGVNSTVNEIVSQQIKIYLAYGIGDNLSDWSDPIICTLVAADVDVTNKGARTYTYKFVPQVNNFFREKPKAEEEGISSYRDLDFGAALVRSSFSYKPKSKESVESVVTNVLAGFVSKVCRVPEGNVIVVIPELNKQLTKDFELPSNTAMLNARTQQIRNRSSGSYVTYFRWESVSEHNYDLIPKFTEQARRLKKVTEKADVGSIYNDLISKSDTPLYGVKVTMVAEADSANNDVEKLPNFQKAISDVFKGLSRLVSVDKETDYLVPEVTYEPSLRYIKLFNQYGLVSDVTKPCVIIGDRSMVLDYLYGNQQSLDSFSKIESKHKIPDGLKISVLTSKKYRQELLTARLKKNLNRGIQSFSDELALIPEIQPFISDLEARAAAQGIPVFINNFTNSNVLSFSLRNSENYFASLTKAVQDNRTKYFYEFLSDEGFSGPSTTRILESLFTSSAISSTNPIALANETYSEALENAKYSISRKNIQGFSPFFSLNDEEIQEYEKEDIELKKRAESEGFQFENLIYKIDGKNISHLNMWIQYSLRNRRITKDPDQLGRIAEFIITLNNFNKSDPNIDLNLIPGLNSTSQSFILSKILEYQQQHSVELTVKTLPMFHLSNSQTLGHPAAFFSKRINIIGVELNPVIMDPFSGEWRITGFNHTISTTECYSEFSLTKYGSMDQLMTLPK